MIFSDSFRRYFTNTSWLLAERIFRMSVVLFVGVFIARYLGPEQFGKLSYAMSFAGLFSALAMLGLDGIVVRQLVKEQSQRDELLGTAFFLRLVAAVLTLVLLASFLLLVDDSVEEKALTLIIAAGFFFQSSSVIDFYFQSRVESRFVAHALFIQTVISATVKVILVLSEVSLLWFAVAILLDSLILSVLLFGTYSLRIKLPLTAWSFSRSRAKALISDSWPLIISGISVTVFMRIDQVMIRHMVDAQAVGQYAVAVRLSEVWYFIPIAITTSVFPAVIRARDRGQAFYYKRLQQLFNLMVILALCIAIPVSLLSDTLIELLFGAQYSEAGTVLAIHVWACVFAFLNNAADCWYLAENKQSIANRRLVAGLLINVILNYYLIPSFGIIGAAWATLISRCLAGYFGQLLCRKTRHLFWMMTKALLFQNIGGFLAGKKQE